MSTSFHTLPTFTQQQTVTPCLLFILQPIYLHNLSLHTSSQPITSLLANQIAHQGFGIFNWLRRPVDSEHGFCTGCSNVTWTTVLLRTPITHMIFFIQGIIRLLHLKGTRCAARDLAVHIFSTGLLTWWCASQPNSVFQEIS